MPVAEHLEPHALLAKALRTLTDEEQGVVLKHLLPVPDVAGHTSWLGYAAARRTVLTLSAPKETDPATVGFLLRLPAASHARLKHWSDQHGYSMNVIVRGLVERFLDGPSGGPSGDVPES